MTVKVGGGMPMRSISLANKAEVRRCILSSRVTPGSSIDKDMHCERIRQMGARKYQRESCYHRIECSATNSLVTLMTR